MATFTKNFDFNLRRDYQKNSYERRAYESVDEKSLSLDMSRRTMKKKKNWGGLRLKWRKTALVYEGSHVMKSEIEFLLCSQFNVKTK